MATDDMAEVDEIDQIVDALLKYSVATALARRPGDDTLAPTEAARRIRALQLKTQINDLAHALAVVAYADGFTNEQPFIHKELKLMKQRMEQLQAEAARLNPEEK